MTQYIIVLALTTLCLFVFLPHVFPVWSLSRRLRVSLISSIFIPSRSFFICNELPDWPPVTLRLEPFPECKNCTFCIVDISHMFKYFLVWHPCYSCEINVLGIAVIIWDVCVWNVFQSYFFPCRKSHSQHLISPNLSKCCQPSVVFLSLSVDFILKVWWRHAEMIVKTPQSLWLVRYGISSSFGDPQFLNSSSPLMQQKLILWWNVTSGDPIVQNEKKKQVVFDGEAFGCIVCTLQNKPWKLLTFLRWTQALSKHLSNKQTCHL